ncbi:MAG: DUF3445 domain-containing protein [Candidatus Obscuribacterales bacterium]|nr:DUF3445 domain-containing protein [Candidatus Obscuribacterales bacterium]
MTTQTAFPLGIAALGSYVPFSPKPYPRNMGVEPITPAQWFLLDEHYCEQVSLRKSLLRDHPSVVFATRPEALEPANELLALMANVLAEHHPDKFELTSGVLLNKVFNERWPTSPDRLHPLWIAAQQVQEDLLLMVPDDPADPQTKYRLAGGCLCFPNRWSLSEKLGSTAAGVHMPAVPFYQEHLEKRVDDFLRALKPCRSMHRVNWGVHDCNVLFQPKIEHSDLEVTPANAGEALFARLERSPFIKLPRTGAVLFGIHTFLVPLGQVLQNIDVARLFLETLESLPPEAIRYKGMERFFPALLLYARSRAN